MDSTFILRSDELDLKFLESIRSLYHDAQMIQITISKSTDLNIGKKETKEEYFQRLEKAARAVDEGNKISFTPDEFDELVNETLK
ncbi:MAG: hypothetical protein IPO92_09700 [Saprospiraceae bacterium]|nr:hypothetical protein [Saprospiraceae bacterium]